MEIGKSVLQSLIMTNSYETTALATSRGTRRKRLRFITIVFGVIQKIGLRWRTEEEVFEGKGQFICGAVGCDSRDGVGFYLLASFLTKQASKLRSQFCIQRARREEERVSEN